jgi:hypothetical protein
MADAQIFDAPPFGTVKSGSAVNVAVVPLNCQRNGVSVLKHGAVQFGVFAFRPPTA